MFSSLCRRQLRAVAFSAAVLVLGGGTSQAENFSFWAASGDSTTVNGVLVTLSGANIETFGVSSVRDLVGFPDATFLFTFDQPIESFRADFSFIADFEAINGFNIAPTSVSGTLVATGGPITSVSGLNPVDANTGSIFWTGLNTTTLQFTMSNANGAVALDSFDLQPLVNGACCTNGPGTDSDCVITDQVGCESAGGLFRGPGTDCLGAGGAEFDCTALLVTFESITARRVKGGVLLNWTTGTELDTVGFRILRESPAPEKSLVVIAPMIAAAGAQLRGASYQFLDNGKGAHGAIHYYIEDIDIFGKVTRHGPIVVGESTRRKPAVP